MNDDDNFDDVLRRMYEAIEVEETIRQVFGNEYVAMCLRTARFEMRNGRVLMSAYV